MKAFNPTPEQPIADRRTHGRRAVLTGARMAAYNPGRDPLFWQDDVASQPSVPGAAPLVVPGATRHMVNHGVQPGTLKGGSLTGTHVHVPRIPLVENPALGGGAAAIVATQQPSPPKLPMADALDELVVDTPRGTEPLGPMALNRLATLLPPEAIGSKLASLSRVGAARLQPHAPSQRRQFASVVPGMAPPPPAAGGSWRSAHAFDARHALKARVADSADLNALNGWVARKHARNYCTAAASGAMSHGLAQQCQFPVVPPVCYQGGADGGGAKK